ncbi:hypothetical protein RQN30_07205 [Arcanobacterium hippocoleae]
MISKTKKLIIVWLALALTSLGVNAPAFGAEPAYKISNEHDGKQLGYLIERTPSGKYSTFLGRRPEMLSSQGLPTWCVNITQPDPKSDEVTTVAALTKPTINAPETLQVTTAQMAYLLGKYQESNDPKILAGISYLIHLNFENEPAAGSARTFYPNTSAQANITHLREAVLKYAPFIEEIALQYVQEAAASAAVGYQKGAVTGAGEREGIVHSLGVTNQEGNYLADKNITVTLEGPAVFQKQAQILGAGKLQPNLSL